jgi:hypothetical protein
MQSLVQVSKLTLGDLADCAQIDACSAAPYPAWSLPDFLAFYDGRLRGGFAAWFHEKMVGFVLYEADPSRRQLQLVRFAAGPGWQVRHVGYRLLKHLRQWLRIVPDVAVWMLAHERALALQCFLRANSFRATRILPGHCDGGMNDAYLFELQDEQTVLSRPLQEHA